MALRCAVTDLKVSRIITSSIEHHAVGHTANHLKDSCNIKVDHVNIDPLGHVDLTHLEELLQENIPTIVSLMHANNEIGNIVDLKKVSSICRKYDAYFHSDTVQTMGHYPFDLKDLDIDFITCAAHKFHGPKGVGFLYIKKYKNQPVYYRWISGKKTTRRNRKSVWNYWIRKSNGSGLRRCFSTSKNTFNNLKVT